MLLVPDKQEAAGSCSQFYAIQIYVSTTSAARKKNVIEKDECFSPLPLVCSCAADSCEVQLLHIKHTPTLVHTHTHSLRLRCHRCCTQPHTPRRALSSHSINRPTHANTLQGIHPPTKLSPNTQITHTHAQLR